MAETSLDLGCELPIQGFDILDLRVPRDNHSLHPLEDFLKREQSKRGYLPGVIPHIAVVDLFKTSGHWQKYKEDMFSMMPEDDAGAQRVNSFGKSLNRPLQKSGS